MAAYGISIAPMTLATSAEEAAEAAEGLGFPVVFKIAAPSIVHKSDVGGVALHIRSAEEARRSFVDMLEAVEAKCAGVQIDGVLVQREIPPGQEIIVGALQDPSFGPLVMFGSGGTEAEGVRDIAFALAPLTQAQAAELMQRTWAGRRLEGFRNLTPGDKAAAGDALVRLSWLAHDHPEIKEIEINPLRALENGAIALDVRMMV